MLKERLTIQKIKILDYLKKVTSHPNAEMVYSHLKHDIPTITLATVYRNLNSMADKGDIIKLEINNEFRFDGDLSNHQHCVCKKCGMIVDVFNDSISKCALTKLKLKNFIPKSVNVIINGYCKSCHEVN